MLDPIDLVEVAAKGDRRRTLEALRDTLARTIVTAEPSNVAALAKQLRDTEADLAGLVDDVEVDGLDELAARRPDATVPTGTTRGRKRRTAGD